MVAGLALGESTPGPLIMVNTFVGFVAGYQRRGRPRRGALAGADDRHALHVRTLASSSSSPGAPLIDRIRDTGPVADALNGVTVAVVGVIGALAVFVGRNALISDGRLDPFPCVLAVAAFCALRFTRLGMAPVIAACAAAGLIAQLVS